MLRDPIETGPRMSAFCLPPRLDLSTAAPLKDQLCAYLGKNLVIDASHVTHLGGLGLQLLLACAKSWRESGHSLTFSPRSEAFDETLAQFGLSVAALQTEVEA
jgi:chemotaxis protein CheX